VILYTATVTSKLPEDALKSRWSMDVLGFTAKEKQTKKLRKRIVAINSKRLPKKLRVAKSRQIIRFPGYTYQKSRYWSNHVSTHIFLDSHARNKKNAKTTVSSHKSTNTQKPSHTLACNKNSQLSTHEKQRSRARIDAGPDFIAHNTTPRPTTC
jgi:hypothetical protein